MLRRPRVHFPGVGMNRRTFVFTVAGAALDLSDPVGIAQALTTNPATGEPGNGHDCVFVSPHGDDRNRGTASGPLRRFRAAQLAARELKKQPSGEVSVYFRAGTYYLTETIVFTAEDSGMQNAPITYLPYPGETVILSGGKRIEPEWMPYRDGIMQTAVSPGTDTDQLFVNGKRQILARYPNYDPNAKYLNGWAADATSPERAKRWATRSLSDETTAV